MKNSSNKNDNWFQKFSQHYEGSKLISQNVVLKSAKIMVLVWIINQIIVTIQKILHILNIFYISHLFRIGTIRVPHKFLSLGAVTNLFLVFLLTFPFRVLQSTYTSLLSGLLAVSLCTPWLCYNLCVSKFPSHLSSLCAPIISSVTLKF